MTGRQEGMEGEEGRKVGGGEGTAIRSTAQGVIGRLNAGTTEEIVTGNVIVGEEGGKGGKIGTRNEGARGSEAAGTEILTGGGGAGMRENKSKKDEGSVLVGQGGMERTGGEGRGEKVILIVVEVDGGGGKVVGGGVAEERGSTIGEEGDGGGGKESPIVEAGGGEGGKESLIVEVGDGEGEKESLIGEEDGGGGRGDPIVVEVVVCGEGIGTVVSLIVGVVVVVVVGGSLEMTGTLIVERGGEGEGAGGIVNETEVSILQ